MSSAFYLAFFDDVALPFGLAGVAFPDGLRVNRRGDRLRDLEALSEVSASEAVGGNDRAATFGVVRKRTGYIGQGLLPSS